MLVPERYERIVQLVNEKGSMRVTELSALCKVTEETIRRDLDRLEREGRLRRSHGGAVSIKEQQPEIPFVEREILHPLQKRAIAAEAVRHVRPWDKIVLDASTTAWYMAAILPDIPLTVLTNSIKVATELSGKEQIEVISTGGQLAKRSLSYVGGAAERFLENYYVDKVFLSCKGVHYERGISESSELQARVKQQMLRMSDQVYLLADASKFGTPSFARVGSLEETRMIITDERLPAESRLQLQQLGLEVAVV